MKRYLTDALTSDLNKKILLLTGPRQVGKTTLAKSLFDGGAYFNYDLARDRKLIHQNQINFSQQGVILDELHKMKSWKRWLKGHYDTRSGKRPIVVTGSAKLDTYKKMGDSLAGRYFQYSLLPLDVKELVTFSKISSEVALNQILELSGFPEPCLSQSVRDYKRWRSSHLDIILKQDLAETEFIKSIRSVELLVELMTERVGSLVSYNSLREDLNTDDKSVKRWFNALENAYVMFKITPYSRKINRAITKSPKYYFYDIPRVIDSGARFENLVALSLYKEVLFRREVSGEDYSLHFLRDLNHKEVDFLICKDKRPCVMFECKLSDKNLDSNFSVFEKAFGQIDKIVLVQNLDRPFVRADGVKVARASDWLARVEI